VCLSVRLRLSRAAMCVYVKTRRDFKVQPIHTNHTHTHTHTQVGKRASTKATYPGLLDVLAAGGQPSGLTFRLVRVASESICWWLVGWLRGGRGGGGWILCLCVCCVCVLWRRWRWW
jgi:hypothetical protein